jgi:hypothetical protein
VVRAATSLPQTSGQARITASSAGRVRKRSCMIWRKPVRTGSISSSRTEKRFYTGLGDIVLSILCSVVPLKLVCRRFTLLSAYQNIEFLK